MKELDTNNSKKLIIGISILFCTVILIIGGTFAFFTQSGMDTTGNIVTANINNTLEYNDNYEENNLYNRQGLIPASIDVVLKSYNREDTQNKCLDSTNNYAACSVYRFSVKNIADVSQELIISLSPTANSYTNLKAIMFEINNRESIQVTPRTNLIKGNDNLIELLKDFSLSTSEEKIYEVVVYIEAKDYDQTLEDSGKTFGAGIRIDSVTSGTYVAKQYGTTCWNTEEITSGEEKGTHELISFNGIKEDGSIDESCSAYVEIDEVIDNQNYYSVTIPSVYGGKEISTLDNMLFTAVNVDPSVGLVLNNYHRINKININEGIKVIEDFAEFDFEDGVLGGTFFGIGGDLSTQSANPDRTLELTLPSTLKHIGDVSFLASALREIQIPYSVQEIGREVFNLTTNLNNVTFLKDKNNKSNLQVIGTSAFTDSGLTSLKLPDSYNLIEIQKSAFSNSRLEDVIISRSVEFIRESVFAKNENLMRLTFEGAEDNTSNLKTIESNAFYSTGLSYLSKDDPLIIPASVTTIGSFAFGYDASDESSLKFIKYMGNRETFDKFENYWYMGDDVYARPLEKYDNE